MQVPQWAGPIPMGQRSRPGPRAMSGGWGYGTNYFLKPGIPVLNQQMVVVGRMLQGFAHTSAASSCSLLGSAWSSLTKPTPSLEIIHSHSLSPKRPFLL